MEQDWHAHGVPSMESLEPVRYLALERIRQRAMNIPLAFHS